MSHEEEQYLNHLKLVLDKGYDKDDRTGTGTISYFSPPNLEFSLRNGILPVLTTKRVALKSGVIPELLWFISGSTDTRILEGQGCNIWKGNTSKEFLAKRGLTYKEKDLGPGYGFQWRHSGAQYYGMEHDYTGQGVDQLQFIIDELRANPDSRRMILASWIPSQVGEMALPPCHILYQVYTHMENGERYLSASMYQRSADSFLGVPFNISSYSLLTHFIANIVGMKTDRIVFHYGDYHIYKNHIDQVKIQLDRKPREFPRINFLRNLKGTDIGDITISDFEVTGYNPHPKIAATMAV